MGTAALLALDDLAGLHPVDAPLGRPTAAQHKAVQEAQRRARQLLPDFVAPDWVWFHAPGASRAGLTRLPDDGPLVYLRDDLTPAQTYAVALHELAHCADADLIPTISREEAEARAEAFAHLAIRGDAMMNDYQALCRRVDQLVAQGLSRTAAWQRVDPSAARLVESAAPTRNGHGGGAGVVRAPYSRCVWCGGAVLPIGSGPTRRCFGRCGALYPA